MTDNNGIESPSPQFLREEGGHTYFNLKQEDIELTGKLYHKFLLEYSDYHNLSQEEILSFPYWAAITHFHLQAAKHEYIDDGFVDGQLYWLNKRQEAMGEFTEGVKDGEYFST